MQRLVIPPLFANGLVLAEKLDDYIEMFYRALNGCLELGSIAPGTQFPVTAFQEQRCIYFTTAAKRNDVAVYGPPEGGYNFAYPVFASRGVTYRLHSIAASYEPDQIGHACGPVTFTVTTAVGGVTVAEIVLPGDGGSYSLSKELSPPVDIVDEDLLVSITPHADFTIAGGTPALIQSTAVTLAISEDPIPWP